MAEVESGGMTIEPAPEWYIRYCARMAQRGLDPSLLPTAPEAEPTNVFSIEAGRVRRATREMLRRRSAL
jgi:hypothetical protein